MVEKKEIKKLNYYVFHKFCGSHKLTLDELNKKLKNDIGDLTEDINTIDLLVKFYRKRFSKLRKGAIAVYGDSNCYNVIDDKFILYLHNYTLVITPSEINDCKLYCRHAPHKKREDHNVYCNDHCKQKELHS